MAINLPTRGQRDWDDELNNALSQMDANAESAKATASSAISTANNALNVAQAVQGAVIGPAVALIEETTAQLPASNGVDDTATINAVLAAGGYVRGKPGESYAVTTLVIPSNTTLDLHGCTITQRAGTTGYMIRYAGEANPVGTGTASTTSGSNVVTTTLGATAVVGQTVIVADAGGNGNGPLVGNVSARTSTTITLTTLDGRPANATATTAGKTVTLYNRGVNVSIMGGKWNKGNNASPAATLGAVMMRHVDGLTVDLERFDSVEVTRGVNFGNCTQARIRIRDGNTMGVMCFAQGPLYRVRVDYVGGFSNDDLLTFQASDFASHQDVAGDIIDASVGDVQGQSGGALLFKVIAGAGRFVDRVKVSGQIAGVGGTYAAWIGSDTGEASTTGGTYGDIDLGTITATVPATGSLWLQAPAATHIKAKIRNNQTANVLRGVYVSTTGTATIDLLELDFDLDQSGNAAFLSGIEANAANVTINRLIVTGRYVPPTGLVSPLVQVSGGVVNELAINALMTSTGQTGYCVRHVGGTLARVNFLGGTVKAASVALRKEGSTATVLTMAAGFSCVNTGRVADCRAGTTTIKLAGPTFDTIVNAAFFTNAGTLDIDGFINTIGTFTMLQRQASEVVRSRSAQLPFDLAALAKNNGDMANNTNAGHGAGLGPAVSNGTLWKNLYTGTAA